MASIFISHSSDDASTAHRLAEDLTALGHSVWLDAWEIKVGDSIVQAIEKGLEECEFLVLLMSKAAIDSGWVEREWHSKYWDEVESGRTIVLPVLIEDCQVPQLLRNRRYAELHKSYSVGLVQLSESIPTAVPDPHLGAPKEDNSRNREFELLGKLSDRTIPLSQILPSVLEFCTQSGHSELAAICHEHIRGVNESVSGTLDHLPERLRFRAVRMFVCISGEINPQYAGWSGDPGQIIAHMERDKENFKPYYRFLGEGVASLEDQAESVPKDLKGLLRSKVSVGSLVDDAKNPDAELVSYLDPSTFRDVLRNIRADLIRRFSSAFLESD